MSLTACTTAPEEAASIVSQSDYRAGFDAYAACMSEAGFPVIVRDDTSDVISYSVTQDSVDAGAEGECYADFEAVDIAWQLQNSYDDPSSVQVRACLEAADIEPAGTVEEEYKQLTEAGLDEECFASPPPQ